MKYLLVAFTFMLSGCVQTLWKHNPSDEPKKPKGGWEDSYNYYVVDPNSDIPDAFFEKLKDAKKYKKEFAANHDYVIVKIDEKYNIYNMQLDK
jgi:hypothetical protein|tara:strand:+ start:3597 stop:3875 length:279 start_codon:yes stop_codon:yes gene_type:complete